MGLPYTYCFAQNMTRFNKVNPVNKVNPRNPPVIVSNPMGVGGV